MPTNKGNSITKRAFYGSDEKGERSHRIPVLRAITNKALSTTYAMTEEVGPHKSGRPSPCHKLCEIIEKLEALDKAEGSEISTAWEMASYPLAYLRELRGEVAVEGDVLSKLIFLVKSAGDANYLLGGRQLTDLNLNELREFSQQLQNTATLARELADVTDDRSRSLDGEYKGAPIQRENGTK